MIKLLLCLFVLCCVESYDPVTGRGTIGPDGKVNITR